MLEERRWGVTGEEVGCYRGGGGVLERRTWGVRRKEVGC